MTVNFITRFSMITPTVDVYRRISLETRRYKNVEIKIVLKR